MRKGCYSHREAERIGFAYNDYQFPPDSGTFNGTLVFKKWSGKATTSLTCYFDADDGRRLKLCVWFSYDDNRSYRPKESDVNMKEVELNTKWRVSHLTTKSGKTKWLTADQVK